MKNYSVLLSCGEANMIIIRDAFDKGYQQGYTDAKSELGQNAVDLAHEESDRTYQQGLNDAWEAAKKIKRMGIAEKDAIFAEIGKSTYSVIMSMSASEAIAKIKEYEEQHKQDTIQAGDEVNHQGLISVVVRIADDCIYTISECGTTPKYYQNDNLVKTGKHYPQIAEVLAEMRGAENVDTTN